LVGRLLEMFARPATRHPVVVLVGLVAATIVLAGFASRLQVEVDLAGFADEDSALVVSLDRVRTEFGVAQGAIQVVVDAGPGGDVLSADPMRAVAQVEDQVASALGDRVRVGSEGDPAIRSLSGVVARALEDDGVVLSEATDEDVAGALGGLLAFEPQLARFISFERDLDIPRARATFVLVELEPELSEDDRAEAARELDALFSAFSARPAAGGAPGGDLRLFVFSTDLLLDGLLAEIEAEMPILLGLALVAVLVILVAIFRSVTDVIVGLVGLVMIVVWTLGLVSILGPEFLGLRGQFTQIGIVVPVLLVGLGIDYSVHLTHRYREQRSAGDPPAVGAHRAVLTVGAALVLATAATALGFASSAAAPVAVIADVGIFTAAGVLCALVVMMLLVTAANTLRRPRARRSRTTAPRRRTNRLLGAPVWVAVRFPVVALVVGGALAGTALVASAELETSFATGDFVPEDSDIGRTYAAQRELFGGDLAETTYVLIDGDLGSPRLLSRLLASHDALAGIEHVRTIEGRALARSIATLVVTALGEVTGDDHVDLADLAEGIDDLRPLFAQLRAAAGAATVDALLARDAMSGVVQIQTMAGTGSATERLGEEILAAFAPVEATGAAITVTSEQLVVAEMAEELRTFQGRSIAIALVAVLVLLVGYHAIAHRRPTLGLAALVPAAFSASMLFGAMWSLNISFNPVTSTITAISLGIGVPYGIHLVNRFTEELSRGHDPAQAVRASLERTGVALTGSALTTLSAFAVLSTSGLMPVRQLGVLGALSIAFALLGALMLEPSVLVLWARRQRRSRSEGDRPAAC
jgi:uncharacterized protein